MIELNQSWAGPYGVESVPLGLRQDRTETMRLDVDEGTCTTGVVVPDPNADLYTSIPWAKDAGLELVQVSDGTWLYFTKNYYYSTGSSRWWDAYDGTEYCLGHPTRAAALKSPPPMPPGFTPKTTTDYPSDVLAALQAKADRLDEVVSDMAAQVEALQRPAPPGYVAAKPLLDELAEVARSEWLATGTGAITRFDLIALSVARRLLERGPSRREIEAGIAVWRDSISTVDSMGSIVLASRRAQLAELEAKA